MKEFTVGDFINLISTDKEGTYNSSALFYNDFVIRWFYPERFEIEYIGKNKELKNYQFELYEIIDITDFSKPANAHIVKTTPEKIVSIHIAQHEYQYNTSHKKDVF